MIPEFIDKDAWKGYLEMRKLIKKPLTKRAKTMAFNKLEELMKQGHDPNKVLDQSTFNSWQGLFPIRGDYEASNRTGTKSSPGFSRSERASTKLEQALDNLKGEDAKSMAHPIQQEIGYGRD